MSTIKLFTVPEYAHEKGVVVSTIYERIIVPGEVNPRADIVAEIVDGIYMINPELNTHVSFRQKRNRKQAFINPTTES